MKSWTPGTTEEIRNAILLRHAQEADMSWCEPSKQEVVSVPTGQELPITGHKVHNHFVEVTYSKIGHNGKQLDEVFSYGPHNGSSMRECYWKASPHNTTKFFNRLYGI